MGFSESLLFYLLIGVAVAFAIWNRPLKSDEQAAKWLNTSAALLFWPVYLPMLLVPLDSSGEMKAATLSPEHSIHFIRIQSVREELCEVMAFISKHAHDPLHGGKDRFEELFVAWESQASRLQQLDLILTRSDAEWTENPLSDLDHPVSRFEAARQQNLIQLAVVRHQAEQKLVLSLTRVRELITAIYVAELTGSIESRAEELIQEIADSLDGLFQMAAWQESDAPPDPAISR